VATHKASKPIEAVAAGVPHSGKKSSKIILNQPAGEHEVKL